MRPSSKSAGQCHDLQRGGAVRLRPRTAALAGLRTAALVATLWLGSAQATTPGVDAPPLAGPTAAIQLPPMTERVLPNGLSLAVLSRPGLPLVSLMLVVRAGPEADARGRSGTAAMTAALLTKGARQRGRVLPATDMARLAESLGGQLGSASGWQSSSLSMTVSTPRAAAALALMAAALTQPLLLADELERARNQALDGLQLGLGSPAEVAAMAARSAFWGDTPHGAVTTPGSLRRITRADVQAFHTHWYRPDNALLVIAGDIDAAAAERLARHTLGHWARPTTPLPVLAHSAPLPRSEPLLLIDMPGSGQSAIHLAAPFVASSAADRPNARIAQLANAVLGGGYSARLNQEVRIRRGLSYGAFSQTESQPGGGMLSAQTQTKHQTAGQALQLMQAELVRLGQAAPLVDELGARQANLLGGFARRLQTGSGLAAAAAGLWAQGRPLADLPRFVDEVLAVTPQQLSDFARSRWPLAAQRAVVAGDVQAMAAGRVGGATGGATGEPAAAAATAGAGTAGEAGGAHWPPPGLRRWTVEQLMQELDGASASR